MTQTPLKSIDKEQKCIRIGDDEDEGLIAGRKKRVTFSDTEIWYGMSGELTDIIFKIDNGTKSSNASNNGAKSSNASSSDVGCISTTLAADNCGIDNAPIIPQRDSTLTEEERRELQIGLLKSEIGVNNRVNDNSPILPTRNNISSQERGIQMNTDHQQNDIPVIPQRVATLTEDERRELQDGLLKLELTGNNSFDKHTPVIPIRDKISPQQERIELKLNHRQKDISIMEEKSFDKQVYQTTRRVEQSHGGFIPTTMYLLDLFAERKT